MPLPDLAGFATAAGAGDRGSQTRFVDGARAGAQGAGVSLAVLREDAAGDVPPFEVVLFRSADLLVRAVAPTGHGIGFITFDSYNDVATLDRPGFGEPFFRSRGIDAVHVISRENRWYQHPELDEVLAVLRGWAARYDRVIAYGSSMGGFAALAYGGEAGAHVALALSPQHSVDPTVVPFENRWITDVAGIAFLPPRPAARAAQQVIAYDPADPHDGAQAALVAAAGPTIAVRAPYGGHPVGAFLNEIGLLEPLIGKVAADTMTAADALAFERTLRGGRRRSGQYLYALAERVPDRRPRQKLALAALAAEAQPDNPVYLSYHAAMLDRFGRHEEARPVHEAALVLPTAGPYPLWRMLLHHRARGDLPRAERLGRRLVWRHPANGLFRATLEAVRRDRRRETAIGRLAWRLGLERAIEFVMRYVGRWREERRRAAKRR